MINYGEALQWALSVKAERQEIVDQIIEANCIPEDWPAKETYFTATTYLRLAATPPGSLETGYAPTIVIEDGFYPEWYDEAKAFSTRWSAIWASLIGADLEGFSDVKWFQKFGSGNAGYNRHKWRAGWLDRTKLQALIDGLEDMDGLITELDSILNGSDQLPDIEFRKAYLREWEAAAAGTQETFEYDYTRTEDIEPSAAERLPLTSGSGGATAWDACAAEIIAKQEAAEGLIYQMTRVAGVDIAEASYKCYGFFGHGKHTDKRGE
jgi:hypothetical protein